MHCILCIIFYALYSKHCILCIVFYALYSMHCILWILFCADGHTLSGIELLPQLKITFACNIFQLSLLNFLSYFFRFSFILYNIENINFYRFLFAIYKVHSSNQNKPHQALVKRYIIFFLLNTGSLLQKSRVWRWFNASLTMYEVNDMNQILATSTFKYTIGKPQRNDI